MGGASSLFCIGDSGEVNGRGHHKHYTKQQQQQQQHSKASTFNLFGEESEASKGPGFELSKVQLNQHQVLLLQQLQPHPAKVLLQGLQEVLD